MTLTELTAAPTAPGEVLQERVLSRFQITQQQLANAMGVSRLTVSQILNNKRSITANTALRLAAVTQTSARFWLDLQNKFDLFSEAVALKPELAQLTTLRSPNDESDVYDMAE